MGRDETVQGAKLEPLGGQADTATRKTEGLDDEQVDSTRIAPLGAGARDEIPPNAP